MNAINWSVRQYNQWCLEKIHGYESKYFIFSKLLSILNDIEYIYYKYDNGTDEDRYKDGLALRNEYVDETSDFYILQSDVNCSVLEMLIALAERIDRGLMGIPDVDNTHYWFWLFIKNLKLDRMTDDNFDEFYISKVVYDWLYRSINYDGDGGLFPLKNATVDQRRQSTWHQLNYYLNENY